MGLNKQRFESQVLQSSQLIKQLELYSLWYNYMHGVQEVKDYEVQSYCNSQTLFQRY